MAGRRTKVLSLDARLIPVGEREGHQLGERADAQFGHRRDAMVFDLARRDAEVPGDHVIGIAGHTAP
jgi:hypothetical protein